MEQKSVRRVDGTAGTVQFYNPSKYDPGGPVVEQAIVWNAFPKELLRRYVKQRAMIEADGLWPLRRYRNDPRPGSSGFEAAVYRPLDEYCEWHVIRDPDTNRIRRVTFSSEPPEYWQAMFGESIDPGDGELETFPGDRERVLHLYRDLVSPLVQLEDLICRETIKAPNGDVYAEKGHYNIYNKWNTTHGIVHLCAPPNFITAEIRLGGDATVLYKSRSGAPVIEPEALICCAEFGGAERNSDPTIGASVNALARAGAMITLPNPVGLYMDHIDTNGWAAPEGIVISDCIRVVRGQADLIERLVVEVPEETGRTVGDLTKGGEPIVHGGQIAECISVKLVGAAAKLGAVQNQPIGCTGRCCIDEANPTRLFGPIDINLPAPPGLQDALGEEAPTTTSAIGRKATRPTRGGLRVQAKEFVA